MSSFLLEEMEIPQMRYGPEDIRLEPCPERVRAFAAGKLVVDSTRTVTMFEAGHLPVYYFPTRLNGSGAVIPSIWRNGLAVVLMLAGVFGFFGTKAGDQADRVDRSIRAARVRT